jgi:regulatory protein
LLAVWARSRRELESRLLQAGFERDEVEEALAGLASAGLIDDERFAEQVVEHARTVKPSGRRAVLGSLLSRGVSRATAERALEGFAEGEESRAQELAARQAGRLAGLAPEVAFRRVYGLLLRRGYGPEVARTAARNALGDPEDA